MSRAEELKRMQQDLLAFGNGPLFSQMPHYTLEDKGIAGPTAAHRIEEVHTPLNLAYLTFTTGSSAFQNIVGVTHQELPARIAAGRQALALAGIAPQSRMVITYPPLVNVFTRQALERSGVFVSFIERPSRDALLVALLTQKPAAVIGESSFLRAALVDIRRLGFWNELPENLIFIAAGTVLDGQLQEEVAQIPGATLHDLYGCQEFGWLCLDGRPLREDITLWDSGRPDGRRHMIVGGLATGDCFLVKKAAEGLRVLTDTCLRTEEPPETILMATTAADRKTASRTARSILRIKGRIVRLLPDMRCKAGHTALLVALSGEPASLTLDGPQATQLFDSLLEAQKAYQREDKTDPVWNKSL
ncbi:hypothetical protein [Anaerotruncus rubiinfantis]|jgi:phenylacetate-coenzyme A ligase PaaK-like adenylate-forming protein|uniref:hypothetical protein n=1 Tax=Anaerotruncus rubiinfantis TaxID=1720200 RepID=UPI00083078C3|nr:hypothetical protein [Anaerotruncus rubiinfantis]